MIPQQFFEEHRQILVGPKTWKNRNLHLEILATKTPPSSCEDLGALWTHLEVFTPS